jgi:hypothetical protein
MMVQLSSASNSVDDACDFCAFGSSILFRRRLRLQSRRLFHRRAMHLQLILPRLR